MKFIKPIKYGKLIDESPKKYIYQADTTDTIIAPYDGVIYETDKSKCDGFVQIAHLIDKKIIYSEICGVNRNIFVGNNTEVKQGDTIGQCGGNNVTYQVKDSNRDTIKIEPFFIGKIEKEPEKEGLKKEKESEKEKEGLKKEPKKEDPNKNVVDDKDKKKWDFNRKLDDIPDLFGSLLLTPLDIVNKAFTFKKKKKEEELNEEIKRMKRLLK